MCSSSIFASNMRPNRAPSQKGQSLFETTHSFGTTLSINADLLADIAVWRLQSCCGIEIAIVVQLCLWSWLNVSNPPSSKGKALLAHIPSKGINEEARY